MKKIGKMNYIYSCFLHLAGFIRSFAYRAFQVRFCLGASRQIFPQNQDNCFENVWNFLGNFENLNDTQLTDLNDFCPKFIISIYFIKEKKLQNFEESPGIQEMYEFFIIKKIWATYHMYAY